MIKRILVLALATLMLLGILCSCGEENTETNNKPVATTSGYPLTTTRPSSAVNSSDKVEDTTDSIWTGNKK